MRGFSDDLISCTIRIDHSIHRRRIWCTTISGIVVALGLQLLSVPSDLIPMDVENSKEVRNTRQATLSPVVGSDYSPNSADSEHRTVIQIQRNAPATSSNVGTVPGDSDVDRRQLIVGTWKRQLFGKRTMTVRADGTATVIFEPNRIWSAVFGNRLRIELDWRIEEGCAQYHMRSGSPTLQFDRARKLFGDHWNETILELTRERLLLLNQDGVSESLWERVTE